MRLRIPPLRPAHPPHDKLDLSSQDLHVFSFRKSMRSLGREERRKGFEIRLLSSADCAQPL